MDFLANPVILLVVGLLIAMIVALIMFSTDPDFIINFFKGIASK